ncbi:amidohydrolase family protein [Granulicella arctica]|uniref:Cytosine/adenosine deaminase-related metal-dependent hydrolase n=1 Tax=Granulicella arctica TaxID=940613 RepID=A0A7Y9PEV1_9BACT|nr:amidohydrolase family protein [Granulicella arctica]NYF78623.1 cytosine/adenosine deaminase-related metal-dependent hydrolase [Granulicella arctica]
MVTFLRSRLLLVVVLCLIGVGGVARGQALLVRNATLFTMASGQREPFLGYVVVERGGRIAAVEKGDPPAVVRADVVWDAGGAWVIPGFISAHSHLWQSAYRGLAADKTLLGWIDALYGKAVTKATPEDLYWFTLEGGLDHLRHGITSTYSFNYGGHTPLDRESFSEAEFRGEMDSGVRFVHGWEPGKAGPAYTEAIAGERLKAFLDYAAAQTKDVPVGGQRLLSVMINGGTAFDGTEQQAVLEAALMKRFNLGNQSHYLEQPETQVADRDVMWPWFMKHGLVTNRMIFGHFIHTTPEILKETAEAGAAMSWNPLSNGRLASGTADIPAYLKAGVRVGMGVDGEASADLADPFENMRTGLYAIRDKYESAAVMSPYDVLRLHTMGSADVLGVADRVGSLERGKMGDFVVLDPKAYGVVFDPYASLVFVTSEAQVERVYVGGELMVDQGKVLKEDFGRVEGEVDRRVGERGVR